MGDLGGTRHSGKPRPLGQVKTENLCFHTAVGTTTRYVPLVPVPAAYKEYARSVYGSDDSVRASVKSMRELRESLRHAALLNIVAAANGDPPHSEHLSAHSARPPPLGPTPSQLSSPHPQHQLNPHQQQQRSSPTPLTLQITSSRGSPFPQTTEGGGRSAGSGAYHSPKGDHHSSSPSPQALVANLLSPRVRTISIPRPGPQAHDLPGPYIHKSLSHAKECLSKVGEMVKFRTAEEMDNDDGSTGGKSSITSMPSTHDVAALKVNGVSSAGVTGHVLPLRAHGVDKGGNIQPSTATTTAASHNGSVTSTSTCSAQSRSTVLTVSTASTTLPPASFTTSDCSRSTTDSRSTTTVKAEAKGSEDRAGNSQHVRRHLTPGKKRELVMRLTEMARCEAVDMNDTLSSEHGIDSVPPMIIMSQQRQEICCPDGSMSAAGCLPMNGADGSSMARSVSGMYRARSLSSLIASNNYHYTSLSRQRTVLKADDSEHKEDSLEQTQGGSMPNLVNEAVAEVSGEPQGPIMTSKDNTEATTTAAAPESLFTDGIVGKTILKDGEGGGKVQFESRPLLPTTGSVRQRRGTRHSGRRSSMGLRDRGPVDTASSTLTTSSTTVLPINSNTPSLLRSSTNLSETAPGTVPSEPAPSDAQTLPILTITGLNRDNPPNGTAVTSANDLRPAAPRNGVVNRMLLFQQLDDQCEKLQRQLSISLSVPRRPLPWQTNKQPTVPTAPINKTDVSIHLQCVALGENRGDTSSSSVPQPHHRHPSFMFAPMRPKALSDLDEQSVQGVGSGDTLSDRSQPEAEGEDEQHKPDHDKDVHHLVNGDTDKDIQGSSHNNDGAITAPEGAENDTDNSSPPAVDGRDVAGDKDAPANARPQSPGSTQDPVLHSVKEPRYQGFSSRVSEREGRSQFHYVHNPSGLEEADLPEEVREMKYRVLKALDQDVYYDFQHRKYRNAPSTTPAPVSRCNTEEDRPSVHFYKVKVNADS